MVVNGRERDFTGENSISPERTGFHEKSRDFMEE